MTRYNHFAKAKYKQIPFSTVPVGGRFRKNFFYNGKRRIDVICIKTGPLSYKEEKSPKEHTLYSDNMTVSSYDEHNENQ